MLWSPFLFLQYFILCSTQSEISGAIRYYFKRETCTSNHFFYLFGCLWLTHVRPRLSLSWLWTEICFPFLHGFVLLIWKAELQWLLICLLKMIPNVVFFFFSSSFSFFSFFLCWLFSVDSDNTLSRRVLKNIFFSRYLKKVICYDTFFFILVQPRIPMYWYVRWYLNINFPCQR